MSALNKGKHVVEEINGVRCTIVEKNTDESRMLFLKDLLETNNFKVETLADANNKYTIGVTDIVFNPIIAVYERTLFTKDKEIVTPAYWNQYTNKTNVRYWRFQ